MRQRLAHRVIAGWPTGRDVRREMAHSLASMLVFAALGTAVFGLIISGHMTVCCRPDQHGGWWLAASLPLLVVWHDFCFCWTRWPFRRAHGVHQRSRNPSPWAACAFHPVRALVNSLVTPLALAAVQAHTSLLLLFALHQIICNAHGHAAV